MTALINATPLRLISIAGTYMRECVGTPTVAGIDTQMWLLGSLMGGMRDNTKQAYRTKWRSAFPRS